VSCSEVLKLLGLNIYFLSGLGVDKRVFKNIHLSGNFSNFFIEWIQPVPNESIRSYAKRMAEFIDKREPFILVGLSFGGMMAVEMDKFVHPMKTIIISSATNHLQLPWFVKTIRCIPLYKIMPSQLLKKTNLLFYYLFGIKTKEEKMLLQAILRDTNPSILKWSIDAISRWNNKTVPENLTHIHGDADKLLPVKLTKANIIVKGGEHFMIYSKAAEISQILNKILAQPQL
jgi:hypothetical protein